MRGPQVFSGYWKKPEETAAVFVPADDGGADWFRTGDIVAIDDDGFVRIVDRIKELIITGGFNVAPSEVEEAIRAHPDVEDCAVVGLPDERTGEQVVAAVVLKPGATFDEAAIRDFARRRPHGLQGAAAHRAGRRPAAVAHRQGAAPQGAQRAARGLRAPRAVPLRRVRRGAGPPRASCRRGEPDAAPLERLRGIRSLVAALEADPAALAAVRAALDAGATWDEVADAAGLSPSAAKYRWAGDDDAIAERQEASRRRKEDRPSSVPTDLPGESVAEAAKRLGVTAQAIYQRVNRGQLEARTVELPDGRKYKRVFVPADEPEPTDGEPRSSRTAATPDGRRARATDGAARRPRPDLRRRARRARRARADAASPAAARGCRAAATCRSPRSRSTPTRPRPARRSRTWCGTRRVRVVRRHEHRAGPVGGRFRDAVRREHERQHEGAERHEHDDAQHAHGGAVGRARGARRRTGRARARGAVRPRRLGIRSRLRSRPR